MAQPRRLGRRAVGADLQQPVEAPAPLGGEHGRHPTGGLLPGGLACCADQGLLDHRQARADQAQLVQPGAGQVEQHDGPVLHHGLGGQPIAEPIEVVGRG
jgi:hypothetical protein